MKKPKKFEADVVAAGEKFEALLPQYIEAYFEWSRLARSGKRGARAAEEEMSKLDKKLESLGHKIRVPDTTSVAGLRAKVLLTIRDSLPPWVDHDGEFVFGECEETIWALLQAAAEVAGLGDMLTDIWQRLVLDAGASRGVDA